MRKLIIFLGIILSGVLISCEKDDIDDCECYFYPKMNEYANCHFENGSWKKALENASYPEDIKRLKQVALYNFKCD